MVATATSHKSRPTYMVFSKPACPRLTPLKILWLSIIPSQHGGCSMGRRCDHPSSGNQRRKGALSLLALVSISALRGFPPLLFCFRGWERCIYHQPVWDSGPPGSSGQIWWSRSTFFLQYSASLLFPSRPWRNTLTIRMHNLIAGLLTIEGESTRMAAGSSSRLILWEKQ